MITIDEIKNKIGLTEKEAKVYFALLREGSGYASSIATVAGIKRSTTYQILERLHEYGIVLKYMKGKKFFFAPAKPRSILEYLDSQEKEVMHRKEQFLDMLPELNVFFAHKQKKPKLVFFDKKQEVYNLLLDSLEPRGNEEVLGFLSLDVISDHVDKAFFKRYAQQVKSHNIKLKLLNYDDKKDAERNTRLWLTTHFKDLPVALQPSVKIIDEKREMTSMIFLAAHKTYLIDIVPPDYMGTVIANQDMTTGFATMFNNLWKKIK